MKLLFTALLLCLFLAANAAALQTTAKPAPAAATNDFSGMYTFLEEGEFVQITVEEQGRVTGFISRYGDLPSDKGAFLDQFFKKGSLEGQKLTFTTEPVHGIWYEFHGTVGRGEGKSVNDEAYYVLKGTLSQYTVDADKKISAKTREVVFKSFPQDVGAEPPKRD